MSDAQDHVAGRIDALEERVAYQDETIEALHETITAQWTEIDALKRQLAKLIEQVEDTASGAAPVDRPPPHY